MFRMVQFSLLMVLGLSQIASADSLYGGPLFKHHYGDKRDFSYHECDITPYSVNSRYYVDGNKVEVSRDYKIDSTYPKWADMLVAANKEKIDTATYIKEQRPTVGYYGILEAGKKEILLFADGGNRQTRVGKDAKELIKMVDNICGKVTLPKKK